jgi:anti-sigma factor RsiW
VTCQEIADFLMDYLDGDLAAADRSIFEKHLTLCPDCVRYLQSYRLTIDAAKSTRTPVEVDDSVPEELVRAILATRRDAN